MPVGRHRTHDKHLPRGVYLKHGAYYLVRYEAGRKRWTRLGSEYSTALAALARMVAARSDVVSISTLAARYETDMLPRKTPTTQEAERYRLRRIVAVFGELAPTDLRPSHVWEYWMQRGETAGARKEIQALSSVMTFARRLGELDGPNPCADLRLPGATPRRRYVTDEEFLALRAIAPPMISHAMNLALICGMDRSTILRLERRNLTDDGILFARGKTGREQLILWTPELREVITAILRERPQLRQALICNRRGRPMTASGFSSCWDRVMRRYVDGGGQTFHFHDLRAKSASDAGSDQEAADRLGHGDARLTRKVYRRLPAVSQPLKIVDKSPK